MSETFGMEKPGAHSPAPHRDITRYLIVIDSAGEMVARLFTETRAVAGEFDASSEEVAVMTKGLVATAGASGAEWNEALGGHSASERAGAEVYTLDV
jgi:hypothetical protein